MAESQSLIESVSTFIEQLKKLESKNGQTRLYRGHSNFSYQLIPSIYRKESLLIENEHQMIYDLIASNPSDLSKLDPFHLLVKLQHYGCPTRLLDLTSNPLVALYFAVNDDNNEDGKVICFDIKNKDILNWNNPEVLIISAFSQIPKEKIFGDKPEGVILYNLLAAYKSLTECNEKSKSSINYSYNASLLETARDNFEKILGKEEFTKQVENSTHISHSIFNTISGLREIARHYIPSEEMKYIDVIKVLNNVLCVKPQWGNNRVQNQHGYFFLYGANLPIDQKAKQLSDLPESLNQEEMIIKATAKDNIRKELGTLGISHFTLFPELDSRTKFIKEKYSN